MEIQGFRYDWNYKLTFEIRSMKLNLAPTEKLPAQRLIEN